MARNTKPPRSIERLEEIEYISDAPMWEDFTLEELKILLPTAQEDHRRRRIENAIQHLEHLLMQKSPETM